MKKLIEKMFGFSRERENLQRIIADRSALITELEKRIANLRAELKNTKQKYTELTMRKNRKTNFAASAAGAQKSKKTKDASVFCANKQ
jgi:predicted RNase H-like nuclease (RuvC/YqgF family)